MAESSGTVFFPYILGRQFDPFCESLKVMGQKRVMSIFVTSLHADLGRKVLNVENSLTLAGKGVGVEGAGWGNATPMSFSEMAAEVLGGSR